MKYKRMDEESLLVVVSDQQILEHMVVIHNMNWLLFADSIIRILNLFSGLSNY